MNASTKPLNAFHPPDSLEESQAIFLLALWREGVIAMDTVSAALGTTPTSLEHKLDGCGLQRRIEAVRLSPGFKKEAARFAGAEALLHAAIRTRHMLENDFDLTAASVERLGSFARALSGQQADDARHEKRVTEPFKLTINLGDERIVVTEHGTSREPKRVLENSGSLAPDFRLTGGQEDD